MGDKTVSRPDIGVHEHWESIGDNADGLEEHVRGVSVEKAALPTGAATQATLAAILTAIGEVQANPTSNTLLDRLKALLTGIVLAAGGSIIGKVGFDQTTTGTTNAVHNLTEATVLEPNATQADQRLTVDATAGGVQFSAFHADTKYVYWTCEDAQCRVTFDDSAPTTTNGHIINVGDSGLWSVALAEAAKFIRTGTTSAVLHASQLK